LTQRLKKIYEPEEKCGSLRTSYLEIFKKRRGYVEERQKRRIWREISL